MKVIFNNYAFILSPPSADFGSPASSEKGREVER